MTQYISKILCISIMLTSLVCRAQSFTASSIIDHKRSASHQTNLQGPVKSAFWYYTYVKDTIPSTELYHREQQERAKDRFMLLNRAVLGGSTYNEFDQKGRVKVIIIIDMDKYKSYFSKSELYFSASYTYIYDNDWMQKEKIKLKKRQVYPVNDYDILVKYNRDVQPRTENYILKYTYDYNLDSVGKIVRSLEYNGSDMPHKELEYVYDDRDNVKRLNIKSKQKRPTPFHFLDTETGFCPDLHIAYEYDNEDRMIQVTYRCKDTLAFEKYTYHPKKGYVTERTRFIASSMRGVEHVTKTMVFYHNKHGDIIEKRFVPDRHDGKISGGSVLFLPESIYYKYDYDKYNNWVKCYMYMEGRPENSEPTAIAQRDLEYYYD